MSDNKKEPAVGLVRDRTIKHSKYRVLAQDMNGEEQKEGHVDRAWQERGSRVKEEIQTINRRLV